MTGDGLDLFAIYSSLLVAGLAGSLHCIGMCGPILVGFAQVFDRAALTVNNQPIHNSPRQAHNPAAQRFPLVVDFACYHAGRIWTYAMLGFTAGWLGQTVRDQSGTLGWQRPVGVAIAGTVIVSGVVLMGLVPIGKFNARLSGCATGRLPRQRWLGSLIHSRGWIARLLLGAVMGLLPCGMVYAVLLVAAALPTPLHSATGMVVFGLGTLPSLTSVLLAHHLVPLRARAMGTRFVAVIIILTGSWMMIRALSTSPHAHELYGLKPAIKYRAQSC